MRQQAGTVATQSSRSAPSSRPGPTVAAPVRLAVLGTGWVSRTVWLPLLVAHPSLAVTAVADLDERSARTAAAWIRTATASTDVRVLADVGEVDAGVADLAILALPNHLHVPVATSLLGRGLSVFVEKPVCRTIAEAEALAAACRSAEVGGARLLSWSAARHRADIAQLRAVLPTLGRLRRAELAWVRAAGVPQRTGWFTERSLAGGGALLDLGWHLLDAGLDLLGWPTVVAGVGTTSADWMGRADAVADWADRQPANGSSNGSVEDTAEGYLVTDDGIGIRVGARWASHAARDSTVLTVEGTEGVATLRGTFGFSPHRDGESSLTVTRRGRQRALPLAAEPIGAEYGRQVDALAAALLAGTATLGSTELAPGGSIAEVVRIVTAIELLYRSAPQAATERMTK
jgi:oxidoreductase